jgi:hypothetical protein
MNNVKNIYAHSNNQLYIKEQINIYIREKFNMNINNIPNINKQIQEYMYSVYKTYKNTNSLEDIDINVNPYQIINKLNAETISQFVSYYINEYKSKQNIFSNSELNDNYCTFTEDSFNNASTFLTEQQKSQQKHIDKIMDRSFNTDSYFSDRNSTMSNIYSDQGFNPRKLHQNIVRQHEENKKRASQYQFNK